MLTCIICSKQRTEEEESKDAVKSLTTQIKDMALKISVGHKGNPDHGEAIRYPFSHLGSSSSTPAWSSTRTGVRTPLGVESISAQSGKAVLPEDENQPKEWIAQVEPGVQISFLSLPGGGNDLKRIRFSRDMFDKWQAQQWWGDNYDRIMELYNVRRFNQHAINTPRGSADGPESSHTRPGSAREHPLVQKESNPTHNVGPSAYTEAASRMTTSSRDESSVSISNASDTETEWIEEDEPGVYITIRQLLDGSRELRRVRFSREKFGEANAKLWWEFNRERIQSQYLS